MGLSLDGTLGISASGNITGGNVVVTNNFIPNNVQTVGNITGGNILTSGSITATGNITGGNLAVTNITGTLLTAAQNNITSVGTLSSLNVAANVTGGNILTSGVISASGNATVSNLLTGGLISAAGNLSVASATMTGNVNAPTFVGNVVATSVSASSGVTAGFFIGSILTPAQNSITSVGTLSSLAVTLNTTTGNLLTGGVVTATGNVTGGNVNTAGLVTATGNVTGGNLISNGNINTGAFGTINTNNIDMSVPGDIQATLKVGAPFTANGVVYVYSSAGFPDIVLNGVDSSISADGNITGANIFTGGRVSATGNITGSLFTGSGAGLTSIPGANVVGTMSVSTTGAAATVTTAAQPNITSVGTLTGLTVSGAIVPNTNGTINLGAIGTPFATIFGNVFSGRATTASYADLAENYLADAEYAPGTVLSFGGEKEVTISKTDLDPTVAGVVSTNPAYHMNSELTGEHVTAIALTGRVPCRVTGTVNKGDMMVSNGDGTARSERNPVFGSVIGKALQSFNGELGTIEIVVGRL